SAGGIKEPEGFLTGIIKENVRPSPGVLLNLISPPNNRAISRLIARPNPVPPNLRRVEPSACWKASNIIFWLSGLIPIPVSLTIKCILNTIRKKMDQYLIYSQLIHRHIRRYAFLYLHL